MSDAPAPSATKQPVWKECKFEHGFVRGDKVITDIRLRKPKGGELRGLNLQDLMAADVNAIITVLPRISDPIMTVADAESLEADDIAEAGGVITGFFFNSAQRAMIEKLTSTN
ncbi:phage tail assembly protein [Sphingopyxis sp. MC1]|uniref:phage tail assembly protein n=1 Tax=Sphingopyxis sp. MC1 TaxID=1174684 RepID=UPI0002D193D2|nr:phage tail assembly protein [Sphingopyxis sp. MC1]ENY81908.1 phage tail protein [Sphingopyxis sp. MC1]